MPIVPQEMVTRMARAHHQGQLILERAGAKSVESVEVALAAEAHRWFWKPAAVKTLLIAESRGFTSQEELASRARMAWLREDGHIPPDSFLRIPYCLAFGEAELVPGLPSVRKSASLWPVWSLLTEIDIPAAKSSLVDRLEAKVRILRRLKQLGIWTVDANLHGLASTPGDGGLKPELYEAWWKGYGQWLYEDLGKPALVVAGRGLFDQLKVLGIPVQEWLYLTAAKGQPGQAAHQAQAKRAALKPFPSL